MISYLKDYHLFCEEEMMAFVPSTNGNNEKIREEFRTVKTFTIRGDPDNQSDTSDVVHKRIDNSRHSSTKDESVFVEQIYHFQQARDGIPIASTRQRSSECMPSILSGGSINNRHRQSIQENFGIQLPLIETHQSKPIFSNSASRRTSEPLGVLPLKRRRNRNKPLLPLSSEDANKGLSNVTDRPSISQDIQITYECSPKTSNSILRTRLISREEPALSADSLNTSLSTQPIQTNNSSKTSAFRLIIQNGLTKDQTEDFEHFRQLYSSIWGPIGKIFRGLEKLTSKYSVPLAIINGERVMELAKMSEMEHKLTFEDLLSTIINRDEVKKFIKQDRSFHSSKGKERAVIVIQSYWRGVCARRLCKYLKKRQRAARVIATSWRIYWKLSQIRKELEGTRRRELECFQKKQKELRENWSYLSSTRHVIVHVPSLGLTKRIRENFNNLPLQENYQIGRLCELEDPNVDIIYVSPMTINEEILQYYNKLVDLRALVEQGSEKDTPSISKPSSERFIIIVPEALDRFPGHHMCLATLLKYSPKALKQIKTLINNRPAYMVTGVSHVDDLHISEYLDIPIYGCEPEVSYLYSTKSGSKRIFLSSNVPMPFGVYDIYNKKHLFESLAQLILEHLEIRRWIFKIDDYYDGLGIAYCDIAVHLPCYQNILKDAEKLSNKSIQKEFHERIFSELPDVLEQHTIYNNKTQFTSWQNYLKAFLCQGGIIEAYPPAESVSTVTVSLAIEPTGHHSILCSGDQLHAESQFSSWGLAFPQSSLDSKQLNTYCSLIVEQCKQRNIYGYIDIDLVTFFDPKTNQQNIWIVDLSIGYSEYVSLFRVMKYITTGQFNSHTHSFSIKTKQAKQRLRNWQNGPPEYTITEKKRYAVWSSRLTHTNLSNLHYSTFFQICRSHGIGFDIREQQGSIFTLLECTNHRNIGMITISDTLQHTLSNFICYLNAIYHEITTTETEAQSNFLLAVNDIENILGVTQDNASNVSLNTTS